MIRNFGQNSNFIYKNTALKVLNLLVTFAFLLGVLNPCLTHASLSDEKAQLQNEVAVINSQLQALKQQKNTLANQLAIYDLQVNEIQMQINASQAQIGLLESQISDTSIKITAAENSISKQKKLLGEYIRQMYIDGQTSQVQLILTSSNFSDFVDKNQYLNTMQSKVTETVTSIEALKKDLDSQKNALEVSKSTAESLKTSQVVSRQAIDIQVADKQSLINQTNGQESNYGAVLTSKAARIAEINAALDAASGSGALSGTFFGVPYYSQQDGRWANIGINGYSGSPMRTYGCTTTSLSMIFNSYGYNVNPGQIANDSRFYSGDLMAWYNISNATGGRFHVVGSLFNGPDLATADNWAANGKPFIVAIRDAFGVGLDHSVVIIGQRDGGWVMNDPIRGGNLNFSSYYSRSAVLQTAFVTPY